MTPNTDRARPGLLWWIYLGLWVLWPLGIVMLASISFHFLVSGVFNFVCTVGLWGYLLSKRLGRAWLWKIIFTLFCAEMASIAIGSLVILAVGLIQPNILEHSPTELALEPIYALILGLPQLLLAIVQLGALFSLVMLVTWIPMMRALWRYAFRCAHIWNTHDPIEHKLTQV
jgi:hypothetical protein